MLEKRKVVPRNAKTGYGKATKCKIWEPETSINLKRERTYFFCCHGTPRQGYLIYNKTITSNS